MPKIELEAKIKPYNQHSREGKSVMLRYFIWTIGCQMNKA
jgi:hypothetical protein